MRCSDKDNHRGLNGFAYGSFQRFLDMKKRGVIKPLGPCDMYRYPLTSSHGVGIIFISILSYIFVKNNTDVLAYF